MRQKEIFQRKSKPIELVGVVRETIVTTVTPTVATIPVIVRRPRVMGNQIRLGEVFTITSDVNPLGFFARSVIETLVCFDKIPLDEKKLDDRYILLSLFINRDENLFMLMNKNKVFFFRGEKAQIQCEFVLLKSKEIFFLEYQWGDFEKN